MFECCFNPIGTIFANKTFVSLRELQYFGKLSLSNSAFAKVNVSKSIIIPHGCTRVSDACFSYATIDTIDVPASVTYLAGTCFRFAVINNLIFRSKTPPKKYGYQEFGGALIKRIYIPDESIDIYRNSNFVDGIKLIPLSEYHS